MTPDERMRIAARAHAMLDRLAAEPLPEARDDDRPPMPFSVMSLADRWSCSQGAIRNLLRSGKLGHFRIGTLIRIPAGEVIRFEADVA